MCILHSSLGKSYLKDFNTRDKKLESHTNRLTAKGTNYCQHVDIF